MARFITHLKDRKVVGGLLFILLVLLPVSLLFTAWLTGLEWWTKEEFTIEMEDVFEQLEHTMTNFRCPARRGLELRDYWDCLWRTTITAKGRRQHEAFLKEDALNRMEGNVERMPSWTSKSKGMEPEGKRVKRQAGPALPLPPFNASDPTTSYTYRKIDAIKYDLMYGSLILPTCQQEILPGVSIRNFLNCILRSASKFKDLQNPKLLELVKLGYAARAGFSLHSTFQPTTYPPMNKSYIDQREYALISMTEKIGESTRTYPFRVDFKPLGDEENLQNFKGADPYLEDDFSVYRYKYNNLVSGQSQVAWTYRGKHGAGEWHNLNLERFYVPLKAASDAHGIEFVSELVQSYPGIGEIADASIFSDLKTPLDFKWTKNSGYNAYTRYLMPLLQKDDLTYYQSKGIIKPSVTSKPDQDSLDDILYAMRDFDEKTDPNDPNAFAQYVSPFGVEMYVPGYDVSEQFYHAERNENMYDYPFVQSYLKFLGHYFNIDISTWLNLKKHIPDINHPIYANPKWRIDQHGNPNRSETIHWEMQLIRDVLRSYVKAVIGQESCLWVMVDKLEKRVRDPEKYAELEQLAITDNPAEDQFGCRTAESKEKAIERGERSQDKFYFTDVHNLKYLYNSYFDRKEARQRYSLPKYPIPFPVCRHNEPSPIDIRTERSRQSSIRDYTFGAAAYRLNRFFMFYPLDGSPLLTVGIVDGHRLDDSSVRLTGGAVKGENLTFQYMHIHFANHWKAVGSEHWINGKGASMELQMVFTISGSADPIKYWHVLARVQNQLFQFREKLVVVLSVLVDVLPTDEDVKNKIEKDNLRQDPYLFEAFAQAAYHFQKMPQINPTYEQPRGYVSDDPVFRFIDFIPRKSSKFYTYRGSLSWPPCFGYVIWSVYEQRLYMSKRQFDQFTYIPMKGIQDNNSPGDNVRRFSDIWVQDEHEPGLNYDTIEFKKNLRTIDRYILVGYHDVQHDEQDRPADGVVGEPFYYEELLDNRGYHIQASNLLLVLVITIVVLE